MKIRKVRKKILRKTRAVMKRNVIGTIPMLGRKNMKILALMLMKQQRWLLHQRYELSQL